MTEWKPRSQMAGDTRPHVAYSPDYGYRIVHFEVGKGLCDNDGQSFGAWFNCTHVLALPPLPKEPDYA